MIEDGGFGASARTGGDGTGGPTRPGGAGAAGLGLSDAHISGNESRNELIHVVTHRNGELVQLKDGHGGGGLGGGPRSKIGEFSRQSRRRLLYLLASIDQEASGLPLFVTLTYPGQDWEGYAEKMKRHLDNFHRWLSYHHPQGSVIWRLEMQKRGAPHFHLLVFGVAFLECCCVAHAWWQIVGSQQASHLAAGTQIKACRRWREATGYMAKYMAKPQEEGLTIPDLWKLPGRFWGVWGRKNMPVYPGVLVTLPRGRCAVQTHPQGPRQEPGLPPAREPISHLLPLPSRCRAGAALLRG
jgi:hypothetical protein